MRTNKRQKLQEFRLANACASMGFALRIDVAVKGPDSRATNIVKRDGLLSELESIAASPDAKSPDARTISAMLERAGGVWTRDLDLLQETFSKLASQCVRRDEIQRALASLNVGFRYTICSHIEAPYPVPQYRCDTIEQAEKWLADEAAARAHRARRTA